MANIIIVDDHHLILESFPLLIEKITEHKVISTFDSPIKAIEYLRRNQSNVDLIISDMKMEEMNGVRFIETVKEKYEDIKVMVISQYSQKEFVVQSLQYGALGYVLKNIRSKELFYAIDKVLKGETYLCNRSTRVLINANKEAELNLGLSDREKEVLLHVALGKTNKKIGDTLFLETSTIAFHRKNIMSKLDAHNVADLTRTAFEIGLLDIAE